MMKRLAALFMSMVMIVVMAATALAAGGQHDSNFDGEYVTAEGWGIIDETQDAANARECAIMDAEANLVGFMQGVHVDRESVMEKHRMQRDSVTRRISGMVRYAEVYWEGQERDRFIVRMRVRAFGHPESSLSGLAFDEPWQKESFPVPTTNPIPAPSEGSYGMNYTGLVIDCRGLDISTAMSPVIRDESHRAIYGHKNLDYDKVVSNGMAGYSHGDKNLSRAGSNPMIVKAVSIDGYFYPVVSTADANAILMANQESHFLDKAAVVIMRD